MARRDDDWFCTIGGRKVYVSNPKVEDIHIEDIAHALSNICRFGGHVDKFYSVAQHCVMCYQHATRYKKEALLHDASEAYLGDMIRPLKGHCTQYKIIEAAWEAVIARKFDLDMSEEAMREVKLLDRQALITERRDVAFSAWGDRSLKWKEDEDGIDPWVQPIIPWGPAYSCHVFMQCFGDLQR